MNNIYTIWCLLIHLSFVLHMGGGGGSKDRRNSRAFLIHSQDNKPHIICETLLKDASTNLLLSGDGYIGVGSCDVADIGTLH